MMERRRFLHLLGACSLAGLGPMAPRTLLAAAPTDQRLVVVLLRGALAGLATVPAFFDPAYREIRGGLAMPEPGAEDGAIDLDGRFGLHPSLGTLGGWYRQGDLAVLHAVATPYRERSHFDGQDLLESGGARPGTVTDGWLGRAMQLMGARDRHALGLSANRAVPLMLRGEAPVTTLAPNLSPGIDGAFLDQLRMLYHDDAELARNLEAAINGRAMIDPLVDRKGMPNAMNAGAAAMLRLGNDVGRLLAESALRLAVVELGGWDTHVGQNGRLANQLGVLDATMAGLHQGLGDRWSRSMILVVTEFGRTARVNGSQGTDHGTGTIAFAAGGRVEGGRVLADWPGLDPTRLYQGRDLAPTTDLRALLVSALTGHMGLAADGVHRQVFPGSDAVAPLPELFRA